MSARAPAALAWGLCALSLGLLALAVLIGSANATTEAIGDSGFVAVLAVAFCAFPVVGALIASRRSNVIGWLFLAIGVSFSLSVFSESYGRYGIVTAPGSLPSPELVMWVGTWVWALYLLMGIPLLFLLFPDGRPLSRRWRPLVWAVIAFSLLIAAGSAFGPGDMFVDNAVTIRNPLQAQGPLGELLKAVSQAGPLVSLAFLAAAVSVVLRLRRSRGAERQQMKVFTSAAALLAVTVTAAAVPELFGGLPDPWSDVTWVALLASLTTIPIAVGVAILRYRLYDIDILINRTLVYGAVTAVLAATYLSAVVLFQALLRPLTSGNELSVAGSTLLVVALFAPLRRRVQGAVDSRFYRSRYDAARTLDAFGLRLRDEVDLDSLRADLLEVVHDTVRPAHASVWLRESAR